jgi:hypothetical protein
MITMALLTLVNGLFLVMALQALKTRLLPEDAR